MYEGGTYMAVVRIPIGSDMIGLLVTHSRDDSSNLLLRGENNLLKKLMIGFDFNALNIREKNFRSSRRCNVRVATFYR